MKKYRIGVDIGGTNVKIALVDFDGKIIYSNTVPTRAEMGYEAGVNNIKQAIKDLMAETGESAKALRAKHGPAYLVDKLEYYAHILEQDGPMTTKEADKIYA